MPVRYSKQIQKTGAAIGSVVCIVRPDSYTSSTVENTEASNWNISQDYPGWIECDGRTLNVSDYRALYSVIGNTYGGTADSTFRLPDYRSKKICGTGNVNGNSGSSLSLATSLAPNGSAGGSSDTAGSVGGMYTLGTVRQLPENSEVTPGSPGNPVNIGGNAIDTFSLGTFRSTGFTSVIGTVDPVLSGTVTFGVGPVSNVSVSAVPLHYHFTETVTAGTTKATQGSPEVGSSYNFRDPAQGSIKSFNRSFRPWPGSQTGFGGVATTVYPESAGLTLSGTAIRTYGSGSGEGGGFSKGTGNNAPNTFLAFGSTAFGSVQLTRIATWTVDASQAESLRIFAIAGNDTNGGERVNSSGESLRVQFSTNGSTYVEQGIILPSRADSGLESNAYDNEYDSWKERLFPISAAYRVSSLRIRFIQNVTEYIGERQDDNLNSDEYDQFGIAEIGIVGTGPDYEYPGDGESLELQRHSHMVFWDEKNTGDTFPSIVSTYGAGGGVDSNYVQTGTPTTNGLRAGNTANQVIATNSSIGSNITKTVSIVNDVGNTIRPATVTLSDASRLAFDNTLSVRLEAAEELTILTPYFRTKYIIKAY